MSARFFGFSKHHLKVVGLTALYVYVPCNYIINNVASTHSVNGPSMSPVLSPDFSETGHKDHVIFSKRVRISDNPYTGEKSELKRGMIVSFWAPHDPEKLAVKRVVGLEGDIVTPVLRKRGRSVVKGPVTVPFGHVWVEGDNHEETLDSNDYGPISKSLIQGVATSVIWPWKRRRPINWRTWNDKKTMARVKPYRGQYEWPVEWEI